MLNASAYTEYVQGRVEKIFGGAYGVYDYKDAHFRAYFDADGHALTGYHCALPCILRCRRSRIDRLPQAFPG